MIRGLFFASMFTLSLNVLAETIVDLYGAEFNQSEKIIKKYAKRVGETEELLLKELRNNRTKNDELEKIILKRNRLIEKIRKEGDFLYVDFNTVFYPGNKNLYTTIEVVNKTQPERLRFIDPIIDAKSLQAKDDLINQMVTFTNIELRLMATNQLNLKNRSCPVYHCISGFHHPKLKPYLNVFNRGAIKEKKLIIDTLNNDLNPERRAAAAFLMGHFTNPKEIISLLLPHINNSNSGSYSRHLHVMP